MDNSPRKCFRLRFLLLLVAICFTPQAIFAQDGSEQTSEAAGEFTLGEPPARDGRVARLIAALMPRNHVSAKRLDDTISERALKLYIKSLGGSPMTVAGAEVPVALEQGVVDGAPRADDDAAAAGPVGDREGPRAG